MDIMIDLETLGTVPGCIIVSIGAVGFDRNTGAILREFYRVIDPATCESIGLTASISTIGWWMRQSNEARAVFDNPGVHISEALSGLIEWFNECNAAKSPVWAHGLTFDLPILEAAFKAAGRDIPWSFWMGRDTRTIYDVLQFNPSRDVPREGTYHNALDDARHQVKCLHLAMADLIGGVE